MPLEEFEEKRKKGKKRIHCKFPQLYLEECMGRQKLEGRSWKELKGRKEIYGALPLCIRN
jgi:hypothetical protein